MIGNMKAGFFILCQILGKLQHGQIRYMQIINLAILSGDVSNTSLSNCGNMRPHVTANPSSNSSVD